MKKISLVAALMVLLCGASLSAKSFDWSQSWCNYGAGIKEGDFLVTADVGLDFSELAYAGYTNGWFMPPVMVEVQYAKKIWKLPFTFGGFAGFHAWGTNYYNFMSLFFGGEAAYHIQLPPKNLDLYLITRLGVNIPFRGGYYNNYVLFGEAIGANWFFNDTFGLNFEIGYPFTKFGASFKF